MAKIRVDLWFSLLMTLVLVLPLGVVFFQDHQVVSAAGGTPKDTATNVTIGSGSVLLGSPNTVVTAVTINGYSGANGLGAYDFQIVFDRTKLQIVSVQGSDTVLSFSGPPSSNMATANSSTGILNFNDFQVSIPGPTGQSIKVARITWQGNVSGTWPLTISGPLYQGSPWCGLADTLGNDITGATFVSGSITVAVPPVASFTKSASSGNAPFLVNFTDTSTGPPTSWSWNFGDGTASTAQNPSHNYTTAGNYTVTLTASNIAGSNSSSQTVASYVLPVANFTALPTSTSPGLPVNFTDSSTGNVASWSWSFGDGTGSSTQNPTKSYAADGTYNVSLTVSNPAGTNTITKNGYIAITTYRAETAIAIGQDTKAYIAGKINRFFNLLSGDTVVFADGIGAFDAYLTYDATGVNMKYSAGVGPFTSVIAAMNTNGGTKTSVNAYQTGTALLPPAELFRVYPYLIGSKDNVYTVTLHFDTITRVGGLEVQQMADVAKTFRRGDANSNGSVNITDALFIAQYLAGLRELGETTTLVNPVNAATARNDSLTTGSSITITDALYIAQMLAGLRDASFI